MTVIVRVVVAAFGGSPITVNILATTVHVLPSIVGMEWVFSLCIFSLNKIDLHHTR